MAGRESFIHWAGYISLIFTATSAVGIFSSYRCSLVLSQVLFFVVFGIYRPKYQETREWWNKKMAVHTWYEEKFCSLLAFFSSLRRRKRKAHLANYIHPSRQWGEAFLSAVAYVDIFPFSAFLNFPHEQLTCRFKKRILPRSVQFLFLSSADNLSYGANTTSLWLFHMVLFSNSRED